MVSDMYFIGNACYDLEMQAKRASILAVVDQDLS